MKDVLEVFKKFGAVITDTHVVYASGKHGHTYINKDAIYPHTGEIAGLCRQIAEKFRGKGIEIVAGPTVGGVILSQWVAHFLGELEKNQVLAVFAEEIVSPSGEKDRFFRRGYDKFIPGKKVLVVEDVLTTGGSAKKVVNAVRLLGGQVVACAALVNRGGVNGEEIGAPLTALINIQLDTWDEKDCPLCKKCVPINTAVGKGKEYLCRTR